MMMLPLAALLALATPEAHVAVLVGISDYGAPELNLNSPRHDVAALAQSLEGTRMEVRQLLDVSRPELVDALISAKKVAEKGVVLFYFSGHAIQVAGENYLIPRGARLKSIDEVPLEAVSLRQVVGVFSEARLRIIVLDACRTNPFGLGGKGAQAGLTYERFDNLEGTLISYAAAPGSVAYDGVPGSPSPFTLSLVRHIKTPGLDLPNLFMAVRSDLVSRTTSLPNGAQRSEELSSLMAQDGFSFVEPARAEGTKAMANPGSPAESVSPVLVTGAVLAGGGALAAAIATVFAVTEHGVVIDPRSVSAGGFSGSEKRDAETARLTSIVVASVSGGLAAIGLGLVLIFSGVE